MVVAAFPLLKVGLLLMKQLSKPVANFIKNEAKRSPKIRKYIIAPTGKVLLNLENKTFRAVKGGKPEPITEEDIIETGSNALGEVILFSILSFLLLAELNRQGDKKAMKEKSKVEEMVNLQDTVSELITEVEALKNSLANLKKQIKIGSDFIELEEQGYTQVHDHNFLEIIGNKKAKFNSKKFDSSSPSI